MMLQLHDNNIHRTPDGLDALSQLPERRSVVPPQVLSAAEHGAGANRLSYSLLNFPILGDERGSLIAVEGGRSVPFNIARAYYIFGTSPGVTRGLHAHKSLLQAAVCVNGSCTFTLDDGRTRHDVRLCEPDQALLIGSMVWREMNDFSPDCVLLVLANQHYDEADYIRDYDTFLSMANSR